MNVLVNSLRTFVRSSNIDPATDLVSMHLKTEAGPEAGDADRRLPAAARLLPHLPPAGPAPCPAPWWSRADVSPFPALLASPQTALLNIVKL